MIGDNKDLFRSFNIYKAFAVYNMVLVHGVSILIGHFDNFSYFESKHNGLSFIRACFSMTLPIFAGFYMRHFLGPFIENYRLKIKVTPLVLYVSYYAFLIEAVRQLLMKWDIGYTFSWHSLHFCALSFFISILIMKRDTRLLAILTLVVLLTRNFFESKMNIWPQAVNLSETEALLASIVWSLGFGLIISGWLFYKKNSKIKILFFWFLVSLITFPIISQDIRALTNFSNLPHSIFFLIKDDQNFWPFMVFYPLFTAGYFFRSFLFDLKNKIFFIPLTFTAVLGIIIAYLTLPKLGIESTRDLVIHREAFSIAPLQVIGVICFFYLSWLITYIIFRKGRFSLADHFVKWTGSVILIYVIHTAIYVIIGKVLSHIAFPKTLILFYTLLHAAYVLSLAICYYTSQKTTRLLRQFK